MMNNTMNNTNHNNETEQKSFKKKNSESSIINEEELSKIIEENLNMKKKLNALVGIVKDENTIKDLNEVKKILNNDIQNNIKNDKN